MIFTATPEPENRRVRLDLDTEGLGEFSSITITRDGRPIRSQPPVAGLSATLVYDYEPPRGRPVSYMADVVFGGADLVRAEDWSSLTGWQSLGDDPAAVAGGKLTAGAVGRSDVPVPANGRVEFDAPIGGQGAVAFGLLGVHRLPETAALVLFNRATNEWLLSPIPEGSGSWSLQWSRNLVTLTTSAGSGTVGWTGQNDSSMAREIGAFATVGGFSVYDLGGSSTSRQMLGASATLESDEALLVHPSQPALTVAIDKPTASSYSVNGLDVWVESSTDSSRDYLEDVSTFWPSGRTESVEFIQGPRKKASWDLVLRTASLDARNQVLNLLHDQTPLLLRSPADAEWDLPDGWYSVKQVAHDRVTDYAPDEKRLIAMRLTPTSEPPVSMVPPRTWGDLLLSGLRWGDVFQAGRTWLDALMGEV